MSFCMDVFVSEEFVRARQEEKARMVKKPAGTEERKGMGISTNGVMAEESLHGRGERRAAYFSGKLAEEVDFSCISA